MVIPKEEKRRKEGYERPYAPAIKAIYVRTRGINLPKHTAYLP